MGGIAFRALSARIGPYLASLFAKNPANAGRLMAALRTAGAKGVQTVDQVIAYAKANPVNMALVVSTIGSIGMAVWDIFDGGGTDAETTKFLNEVKAATSRGMSVGSGTAIAIGDKTIGYEPGLSKSEGALVMMSEAVGWATQFFGSRAAAVEGVRFLELLFAVPDADRVAAFKYLRTPSGR